MAKDAKKSVTVDQLSAVATKVKTWGKNNFVEDVTLSSGKIQKTINGTTTDVATIPTSLPNPNSLKLQAGGTDKVTYDGSSSATLNIASGSSNGTISVGGTDVSVTGLGSLAYVNSLSASDVSALPSNTMYAGSSTAGGAATSAAKLTNTSKIGDTNKPVYFTANGVPAAVTHTLDADVPSNAVFTDTTYESKSAASGGTDVSLVTTGEKYTWNNKQDALSFNQTPSSSNKVATMADIPSSLPANGGNSATVNNHSVNSDVPANAVFTDTNTTYGLSINGSTNGDSNGTSLGTIYAPTTAGTSGYVLTSNGSGAPTWAAASGGGGNIDYTTTTSNIQNIDATIISTALRKTAQTLTAAEKTQVKTNLGITISTSAPTSADGENGDIWLVYEA